MLNYRLIVDLLCLVERLLLACMGHALESYTLFLNGASRAFAVLARLCRPSLL